jgi:CheY-like chemotaxis protein
MPEAKILVVDDEEDVRERLGNFLARRIDCALEKAASGEEALKEGNNQVFSTD